MRGGGSGKHVCVADRQAASPRFSLVLSMPLVVWMIVLGIGSPQRASGAFVFPEISGFFVVLSGEDIEIIVKFHELVVLLPRRLLVI